MTEFQDGTYIFRVSLGRSVWRRIAIPAKSDFDALSDAILGAFEFDHDHLYKFTYKSRFGVSVDINHPYVEEPPFTDEVQVGGIGLEAGAKMTYLYDFGDNWEFEVLLERIELADPKMRRPVILETHGKAPEQYSDWDE